MCVFTHECRGMPRAPLLGMELVEVFWYGGVVTFTGLVAYTLAKILNREGFWQQKRLYPVLHFVLFALFETALGNTGIKTEMVASWKTWKVQQAMTRYYKKVSHHPRVAAVAGDISTSEEEKALASALSIKGTLRLSPARLLDRARLLAQLAEGTEGALCVALLRGQAAPKDWERRLASLSGNELGQWMDLQWESVNAFLENRPPSALGKREIEITLGRIGQDFPGEQFSQVLMSLGQPEMLPPDQLCKVRKALLKKTLDLPAPYNLAMAILINS